MEYIIIAVVACGASLLTFFSGFGLGTILMPIFALFLPIEVAIAGTGVVHLLNNIFKISLVGRSISKSIVLWFGIPGMLGAALGAYSLLFIGNSEASYMLDLGSIQFNITPIGATVGCLLILFASFDIWYRQESTPSRKWLPIGGLVSGFFGGLSGHQGALRSAFLIHQGLSKEVFIASGIAIACLIDLTRIPLYFANFNSIENIPYDLFLTALIAAFIGAFAGKKFLKKITLNRLHQVVGAAIILIGLLMILGVI